MWDSFKAHGGPINMSDLQQPHPDKLVDSVTTELEALLLDRNELLSHYQRATRERDAARAEAQELRAERDEALVNLRAAQYVVCSWCGERTPRDGKSDAELEEAVNAHVLACEKRPEKKMLDVIYACAVALGVDLDSVEGTGHEGLIDAFQKRWDVLCNGRDELVTERDQLRERLAHSELRLRVVRAALSMHGTALEEIDAAIERLEG